MSYRHGTSREAIAFANKEIQQYRVGEYIKIRKYNGGDDPPVETIYQITRIQEGNCTMFSTIPPVFYVKGIEQDREENLIHFVSERKLRGTWYHAVVSPFAFYNDLTHQYENNSRLSPPFYTIYKLDNVAAKEALISAINEKKRRQERLEHMQKEMENQAENRRKENDSISQEELSELLNQLKKR